MHFPVMKRLSTPGMPTYMSSIFDRDYFRLIHLINRDPKHERMSKPLTMSEKKNLTNSFTQYSMLTHEQHATETASWRAHMRGNREPSPNLFLSQSW